MVKYTDVKPVMLKLPIGIYEDILEILSKEPNWLTPQDFIKEAIKEKIERWKKENPPKG